MQRGGGGRRRAANAAEGAAAESGHRRRAAPPRRKRLIDYPRSGYLGLRRWVPSWKQVLGTTLVFMGLSIGSVGAAYAMIDIPDANQLALSQSNVYYWADGTQMVTSGGEGTNRLNIEISDIPEACQDSVISAENATFWEDSGIDPVGIGRAVVNMARGGEVQSGSTITQQFVKNMYLSQDQTITRKARELLLSVKVGTQMDKEDILAGYFNTSYFGRGAYGIEAAAQAYYEMGAAELNDSQCAFLTSLLRGAGVYDPFATQDGTLDEQLLSNAEGRWAWVLDRRVEVGTLNASDREQYTEFPMPREPTPAMNQAGQIGYMTQMVNDFLVNEEVLTDEELAEGGYHIYTTFQRRAVNQMEAAVHQVEEEYLDAEERPEDRHVQFGGASVVPGDGAITAIYGGEDYTQHFTNNASSPNVQVGSTFKPFVLAAAMRDGVRDPELGREQDADDRQPISLDSVYLGNDNELIEDYDGTTWHGEDPETGERTTLRQNNFEGGDYGEITLWEATAVSANSPFVQLGMDVGPATVRDAALDAGLLEESLGPASDQVPSFSLGVSTPGPMRMASAYSTFAAGGEQADPYSVTRIDGPLDFTWEHEVETEQPFSSDVAANINAALHGVTQEGGSGARVSQELDLPAAGKTGTTDDNRSAWFTGYTPNLSTSIGMWRAPDSEEDLADGEQVGEFLSMRGTAGLSQIYGGSLPLDVWLAYMQEATAGDDPERFPQAPDVGEVVYGGGATAPEVEEEPTGPVEPIEPTEPIETPDEPTQTPDEPEQTPTFSPSPSITPSPSCAPWDPACSTGGTDGGGTDTDGTDTGGTDGGATGPGGTGTGGTDEGATEEDSEGTNGNGGSIFGRGSGSG